ncbi:sensor domain-containing diguanylate cyclase [Crenobacter intestini]|uniref:diguanylate cyclase n=1 Tax=Crenobacter intestini TaxID=2563443 RepID=A0A4T0UQV4_9NEIS|nr:sensor domain-containing diguanylate cyclase [Crenobacter intestini]TIC81212.1 sensor domain-containing diguanylate cyclase [Crenobacter intestini]
MADQDLAALRAELASLREENAMLREKLAAALDGTGVCLWQGEPPSGRLTVFNLQDFDAGDMAPDFSVWLAKLHPDDHATTLESYYGHLAGERPFYEAEYRTLRPDGAVTWLWDRGRVVERDENGQPLRILGAHIDITRRKAYEAQLARLAHHDALTGLPNRRPMLERLRRETEARPADTAGVLALAMLDIDHFKTFNDRFGHDVGDRVLAGVGQHLAAQLAEGELCCRWGGEEFLLLLHGASADEAALRVERIRASFAALGQALALPVPVGASVGVAAHRAGETFMQTIRRADHALLAAKQGGRDRVCRG